LLKSLSIQRGLCWKEVSMKRFTILCGFLFVLGVVGWVTTAQAMSNWSGVVVYYTDSTYSVQSGYTFWSCSGVTKSGYATIYSIVDNPFESCGGTRQGDGSVYCTVICTPIPGTDRCSVVSLFCSPA
jgi:hypothetical protein